MKFNKNSISRYLTILIMLLMSASFTMNIQAQDIHERGAEISKTENVIQLNSSFEILLDERDEIKEIYTLDISSLSFQTEEQLEAFCKLFSMSFHSMTGNFSSKEITMRIDKDYLANNEIGITDINEHFEMITARMVFIHNNLN